MRRRSGSGRGFRWFRLEMLNSQESPEPFALRTKP